MSNIQGQDRNKTRNDNRMALRTRTQVGTLISYSCFTKGYMSLVPCYSEAVDLIRSSERGMWAMSRIRKHVRYYDP